VEEGVEIEDADEVLHEIEPVGAGGMIETPVSAGKEHR
jgi:hypothetical protein